MQELTVLQQLLAGLSGAAVGFTLGLIGGGGSILAVPLLLYAVGYRDAHVAIGTTALAVAATALLNLVPHWRAGNVRWKVGLMFALPGVIGTSLGAQLGRLAPSRQLLFLFALLMLFIAGLMIRGRLVDPDRLKGAGRAWRGLPPVAFGVGLLAGFFGIGGGFLIVPGLLFATGMPMVNAIGTSLLSVGAFGLTTAATYAVSGLVDWRVAAEYIAGGLLGGSAGALLATRLGARKTALTRIFAAVIVVVALYMLWMNLGTVLPRF